MRARAALPEAVGVSRGHSPEYAGRGQPRREGKVLKRVQGTRPVPFQGRPFQAEGQQVQKPWGGCACWVKPTRG